MRIISLVLLSLLLISCENPVSKKNKSASDRTEMTAEELANASEAERAKYIKAQVSRAVDSLAGVGCEFGVRGVMQSECMFNLSEFYAKKTAEEAQFRKVSVHDALDSLRKNLTNKRLTHSENKKFIAFYALNKIRGDAKKYCVNGGLNQRVIPFLEMVSDFISELQRIDAEMISIVKSVQGGASLDSAKTRWRAFRSGTFKKESIAMFDGDASAFFEKRLAFSKFEGHSKDNYSLLPSKDQMTMSTRVIWDFETIIEMIANRPQEDTRVKTLISRLEALELSIKERNLGYAILQLRETKVSGVDVITRALDLMDDFKSDDQCFGYKCVDEARKIKSEVSPCAD